MCVTDVDVHLLQIQGGYLVAALGHGLFTVRDHCVGCHKSAAMIRRSDIIFPCDINIWLSVVEDSVCAGYG